MSQAITIINFAHALTLQQQAQIEQLCNCTIARVIDVSTQVDNTQPLAPQVTQLIDAVGLSQEEWDKLPLLINPPSYAPLTVALLAQLHGRMGNFPTMLRIRPIANSTPVRFEVAELLNLQTYRETGRKQR